MSKKKRSQKGRVMVEIAPATTQWIDQQIKLIADTTRKQYGIPSVFSRKQYLELLIQDLKTGRYNERVKREVYNSQIAPVTDSLLACAEERATERTRALATERKEGGGYQPRYERLQGGKPRLIYDYVGEGGHREELFDVELDPVSTRIIEAHLERNPNVKTIRESETRSKLEQTLE